MTETTMVDFIFLFEDFVSPRLRIAGLSVRQYLRLKTRLQYTLYRQNDRSFFHNHFTARTHTNNENDELMCCTESHHDPKHLIYKTIAEIRLLSFPVINSAIEVSPSSYTRAMRVYLNSATTF